MDASITTGIGHDTGVPPVGNDFDRHVAYWRDALAGAPAMLELPTDRPRAGRQDSDMGSVEVGLDRDLTARLEALSARHGASLQTALLAAWAGTLARLSSQDDIVIGIPADRDVDAASQARVGPSGDALPLRIDLSGQPTVSTLLARVERRLHDAYAHAVPTFEGIAAATASLAGATHSPVFQTMLAFEVQPAYPSGPAGLDLALELRRDGDGVAGTLRYASGLLDAETAERYAGYWQRLLTAMTLDDTQAVSRLPILGEDERNLVLQTWNATAIEYPRDACMHELFEAQAARTPDAVALVAGDRSLTYAELNGRANRLAHHLRTLGLGPDERVGICVQRNADMLVALLASLKSGAAYVPLDPSYPPDRLGYMLDDAMPRAVLTDAVGRPVLSQALALAEQAQSLTVLDLQADAGAWEDASDENPAAQAVGLTSKHLAYLIYTSGSTGRPKGVAIEHRNAVNFIYWALQEFSPQTLSNCLFSTSINFDLSIYEYGVPLACGGRVTLVDNALALLNAALPVTLINTVPSVMMELSRADAVPPTVRVVNVAGEPLKRALAERILASAQVEQLCNLYGPSETTTYSTWTQMDRATGFVADIGRPVGNTQVYILDAAGNPVPVGVAGEIFIGGHGVARGYLGKPELTADRFLDDPFNAEPGARMYKTGDLGRWSAQGTITLLGRNDFQVKIRGFRIELGEIEAKLGECAGVREAVVIARDDEIGGKRLIAYCLADEALDIGAIRDGLASALPDYMVPSAFVRLAAWPLTANGKLDRKALPEPDDAAYTRRAYAPPQGPIETTLASIWSELLRVEQVGRNDDFFELGGHSLLAVQLVSRVRKALDIELTFRDVFEASELRELAERLPLIAGASLTAIVPVERRPLLPMPQLVKGFWVLTQLNQATSAYHIGGAFRLSGELDRPALERSWQKIVDRHEILRTRFVLVDGEPLLSVDDEALIQPRFQDIRDDADPAGRANALYSELFAEPFDLGRDVPLRAQVLQLQDRTFELQWVTHHIVSDGWSIGVMLKELSELYAAQTGGAPASLPTLPVQYIDYAAWKGEYLAAGELDRQIGYWREALSGAPPLLELPTDRPRPPQQDFAGAAIDLHLDEALTTRLKTLSRRHGATLYMTILASWAAVFSRLSGQSEVVIGSPVAGRNREEIESLIGFFVNTFALRIDLDGDPSTAQLLARTRRCLLDAQAHQDVLFDQVVEAVKPPRSTAHNQIFQVMLAWQSHDEGQLALPGVDVSHAPKAMTAAQTDLLLDLREKDGCITGFVNYMTALFDRETIERFAGYWERLLRGMVADSESPVASLPLLEPAERDRAIATWNETAQDYPRDRFVHELFEAQAQRSPQAIAVVFGDETETYQGLDRRANHLARRLRAMGVAPGDRVAICAERGIEMLVAVLAVLKSGAAYVPLDIAYPRGRLVQIVEDGQPAAALVDARGRALLDGGDEIAMVDLPRIALGQQDSGDADDDIVATQLSAFAPATHPAYVLFTSGSTGRPKGVCVPHRAVVNFLCSMAQRPGLKASDTLCAVTTLSFDISVLELLLPLTVGARVVVVDRDTAMDGDALAALIERSGATVMQATPATWRMLLETGWTPAARMRLLCGGEAWQMDLGARLLQDGAELWNMYGPTETTVWSTIDRVTAGRSKVTLGKPIANTRVYVLDKYLQPVPTGANGELWIGGDGVALGYHGRPDLSAERFVRDPFAADPEARMYRTGDLGRWSADGALDYLGRNDFQVKIRGFRIELGEIEARLIECAGVREAAVLAREDAAGEKRLVAYCLGDDTLDIGALRETLASRLPEYMVPSAFVRLDAWPLTPNGKLDRKALPAPDDSAYARRAYEAPQGAMEERLATIWAELLRVEQVGRHDDFFELGGHSLLAVQLASRVRKTLDVELSMRDLFEQPTLWKLAAHVTVGKRSDSSGIATVARQAFMPLSQAQQRLWFLSQIDGASSAYHLWDGRRLRGALDLTALAHALDEVVARHEVLRTRFVLVDGQPMQQIAAQAAPDLRVHDLRGREDREAAVAALDEALFAQPFDLERDALLRVQVTQLDEQEFGLALVMHHIICDGWSIGVLLNELSAAYAARVGTVPSSLPPLPVQYVDYAQWQRQRLADGEWARQAGYWRETLAGAPALLEVPTDRPRPSHQAYAGDVLEIALDTTLTARLKALSQRHGATLYMTLLASWAAVLGRLSGQDEVVIGSPVAGRNRVEVEPLIGFFVNTLALRIDLGGAPTVAELLARTRRRVLEAQSHQDLPFDQVVDAVKPPRNPSHTPVFQTLLAWQTQDEGRLSLPGIEATPTD
ncbi:amino acid adenylation domain-containing protein, partial [Lysobacter sp. CA199]|uniref:amino acid adenylation domain-containing protein n=1 Tax=Lysobacter sp. CA199 TaxID=3455608 RepID=UPI003F8D734F